MTHLTTTFQIHGSGMRIHAFTFANDCVEFAHQRDPNVEYLNFLRMGVDGFITKFPGTLKRLDTGTGRLASVPKKVSFAFPLAFLVVYR